MDLEYGTIRVDKIITTAGEVDLSAVSNPATQTDDGVMSAADKTKLDGVEAGAQANDPNTVVDPNYVATDENFTTADHTKLDGVEAGAQVNAVTSVNGLTGDITVDAGVNNISLAALPELP